MAFVYRLAAMTALGWVLPLSAAPPCLVDAGANDGRAGMAAGCFIKRGDRLLVVKHRHNGKLGVPAGFSESGESAQCTAHRETWEEAGVAVEVGQLLKRFGNGFLLYRCRPLTAPERLDVPPSGLMEVSAVVWINPPQVGANEWRFSWQYPLLLKLFQQEPGD